MHQPDRGFTLIELAIILVIIGILLGMGASMLGTLIKRGKDVEDRQRVKKAAEEVVSFVERNGRLPTDAEFRTLTGGTNVFGKPFVYVHPARLETSCTFSDAITFVRCKNAGCTDNDTVSGAAFVIISPGLNQNVQAQVNNNTVRDYYPGVTVDSYPSDMNRPEPYDDNVEYATLHDLRKFDRCKPLAVSDEPLPDAVEDSAYSARIEVTGGVPPYTFASVSSSGITLQTDGAVTGAPHLFGDDDGSFVNKLPPAVITLSSTVTDSVGNSVTFSKTIHVYPQKLSIVTPSLPAGVIDSSYEAKISASGGVKNYQWKGCPPPSTGLSCLQDGNDWVIKGTPSAAGTYDFVVKVADRTGAYISRKFVIVINDSSSGGGGGGSNCSSVTIRNSSGRTLYLVNPSPYCRLFCGACPYSLDTSWRNGSTITLSRGETRALGIRCRGGICSYCYRNSGSVSYSRAVAADLDGDCKVEFDGSSYRDW